MPGNSFGTLLRITTFGESHGKGVGVVVDGCPAGFKIDKNDIQQELDRRRPGQSDLVSPRGEKDEIEIYSGIFDGKTTGAPIMMMVINKDVRSRDYENLKDIFRPSHADFTYQKKYGFRDYRGGGRSSARETLARVAAGAIAKKYLREKLGVEILSYVEQVGTIKATIDYQKVKYQHVEKNEVRCPDSLAAKKMAEYIKKLRKEGDSVGGIIKGVIRKVPAGFGEPVFDKLSAELAKAMMSINAAKGFEVGSGFQAASMTGSSHNDEFFKSGKSAKSGKSENTPPAALSKNSLPHLRIGVRTNYAGGILGGISSGQDIYFRVAFKPIATILKKQNTVNLKGKNVEFRAIGRHDSCVVPRAVPIVDAMSALVLMDFYLLAKAYES